MPASAELWFALGCVATKPAAAEQALQHSLRLEPRQGAAWTALGRLYAETGGAAGRELASSCYMQAITKWLTYRVS